MKIKKISLILFAAVLLITLFSGCGDSGQTETTTPTLAAGEPEYAPALAEGILQSLNDNDYEGYIRNCDENMKTHTTAEYFSYLTGFIQNKIGSYESREFSEVQLKDIYTMVIYKAKFTEEKDVTVSISFLETEDKVLVSGLWFDSPKLRDQ